MRDLIEDTAFGHLLRFASGGRIFGWEELQSDAALNKYLNKRPSSETSSSIHGADQLSQGSSAKEKDNGALEKGNDVQMVDWLDNDPHNPMNWSSPKKIFVTFQICLLTTSVYIGSAIYTAGIQGVVEQFGVSDVAALLGLTLFIVGYGLGPMFWSPLSEIPSIGRNPIYIGTLAVFVALQPAVIYAQNFGMLLAFRFLTGFIGSPVLATGGATIGDMYAPNKKAYAISIWGLAAVLGPVLGPLVGGFAYENEGWTWTIWELMWLSAFCLVFVFFFLPETSGKNILYRRTARMRKALGESKGSLKCKPEIEAEGMTSREIAMIALVRPFTLSFFEPILLSLNLYIALLYALLYLWFESFPLVFIDIYGFNSGELGLAFLGILISQLISIPPFWWYLRKYVEPRFDSDGNIKPELRLPPACLGGFFIPICLFWFGWSSRASVHWIMPIIGSAFFTPGVFLLFNSVLNYIGDAYPDYAASAFAGNDLIRSAFAAGFPLFADAMYTRLGIGWASSLLAFLSIAFIPIPFVLYIYGGRIRKHSKNARHDI